MIYKNPLSMLSETPINSQDETLKFHGTVAYSEKTKKYLDDSKGGAVAYTSDGRCVPLHQVSVMRVEFIGGLWRVQDDFPHEIMRVRDKQMVVGEKYAKVELGAFHYYDGYSVSYNCYGPFIGLEADRIIGRVETATGNIWAYGKNIPEVRAFLSVALFDRQRDKVFIAEGVKRVENSR